ncbi:MAG: NAD(P)/FAD-dependent oxidoreductase [Archaeoglobi archaeon]|nr:NAD(P)/FAD-dependent oxidoreductase [Archaeoglobi archaeon]
MRVGIVGAGLGGLLTGAILAENGYRVEVFERLPFIGGRFTSISYKGYEVSTGALHMIPHGSKGPLARLLRRAGCRVEIVDSRPEAEIYWNGEREVVSRKSFPFRDLMKLNLEFLRLKLGRNRTLEEFGRGLSERAYLFMRAFLGWSLSVFPDQISFGSIVPIYRQTERYRGPGIPVGGCRAVVEELAEVIKSNDGVIAREEVTALKPGESFGVYGKERRDYDVVVSNLGHKLTMELLGERYGEVKPESRGVKYTIALDEPFVGHTGVLFTLGTRIAGMNEVTNADDNLGKKHMLQAHQPLREGSREEILAGLKELREILKGYSYEVIAVQSYKGDWPVNRVMAGMKESNSTPYRNLYVVGDGAKGEDIEVDGVALGVERVLGELL